MHKTFTILQRLLNWLAQRDVPRSEPDFTPADWADLPPYHPLCD